VLTCLARGFATRRRTLWSSGLCTALASRPGKASGPESAGHASGTEHSAHRPLRWSRHGPQFGEGSFWSRRTCRPGPSRTYTDDRALLAAFLARQDMPIAIASIRREPVEAFIAAELDHTAPSPAATRYRSLAELFGWVAGAASTSHRRQDAPAAYPRATGTRSLDDQIQCVHTICA